jgi:hypothetical protein
MKLRVALAILLTIQVLGASAQERYSVADFSDFTKSSNEHVIDTIEGPFVAKAFRGRIVDLVGPMQNILIEVQGPNGSRKIRGTRSDQKGYFEFRHLSPGKYKFKTTMDSWQSCAGTIIITKKAVNSELIVITLRPGT